MVGPSSRSAADREPDCSREAGPLQVGRATLPRVRISLLRTRELVRHSLGGVEARPYGSDSAKPESRWSN